MFGGIFHDTDFCYFRVFEETARNILLLRMHIPFISLVNVIIMKQLHHYGNETKFWCYMHIPLQNHGRTLAKMAMLNKLTIKTNCNFMYESVLCHPIWYKIIIRISKQACNVFYFSAYDKRIALEKPLCDIWHIFTAIINFIWYLYETN